MKFPLNFILINRSNLIVFRISSIVSRYPTLKVKFTRLEDILTVNKEKVGELHQSDMLNKLRIMTKFLQAELNVPELIKIRKKNIFLSTFSISLIHLVNYIQFKNQLPK